MLNFKQEYINCYTDRTRKYFIENYLYTFDANDRKQKPFKLFPRQIELVKSFANNNNTIAIKHRQAGITTVASAWITGQCVFAKKSSPETVLCIGNKFDTSQNLVEKIATFLEQVPRWMWGSEFYSPDPDSEKNKKSIYKTRNKQHIELFNGCQIYARASSEHASRGISAVSILVFDEAAMIQNSPSVYSSAVATTSSVKDAKILMISTPFGKDQLYYKTYSQAVQHKNNFTPVEFKWFQDPRYNRHLRWYRKDEKTGDILWKEEKILNADGDIEYNETKWEQLEKDGWTATSPWFESMCKSLNNDEQKIAQELLVSFLGSSDNVVPQEIIEAQSQQNVIKITDDWKLRDVLTKETWIWRDPIPGHRYVCSVDPSSGSGEDYTAIQIVDADACDEKGNLYFEQVLEYNGKINGERAGYLVDRYARIYNNALVVVEAIGGYGDAVILTLLGLNYPNMYYDDPALKTYTIQRKYSTYKVSPDDNKLPGFHSSNLRIQMISNFVELIKNNAFRIRSERVISELETWVFRNGRPDHMDSAHDDLLTCLAMGLFIMEHYMLRKSRDRVKDEQIVKSWYINDYKNTNMYTKELKDNLNISQQQKLPKKINPFAAMYDDINSSNLKGCIMLGGFKTK